MEGRRLGKQMYYRSRRSKGRHRGPVHAHRARPSLERGASTSLVISRSRRGRIFWTRLGHQQSATGET
eukprot:8399904-Pyramimonas_sp.AAC.1